MTKALKLFPLLDFELEKTTFPDIIKKYGKEKVLADSIESLTKPGQFAVMVDGVAFIVSGPMGKQVFTKVVIYDANAFPKDWEKQGLKWNMTWDEWIEFFKKTNGNHYVISEGGEISSVAKLRDGAYVQINLIFKEKNVLRDFEVLANTHDGEDLELEEVYKGKIAAPAGSDSDSVSESD